MCPMECQISIEASQSRFCNFDFGSNTINVQYMGHERKLLQLKASSVINQAHWSTTAVISLTRHQLLPDTALSSAWIAAFT